MSEQSDSQNLPRLEFKVHFRSGHCGRRQLSKGPNSTTLDCPNGDLPRLTRLLALAHRWNRLIEEGVVASRAEIAKMMGLSRARVTQIMDLLYLAPGIQECLLLPRCENDAAIVPERAIRSLTGQPSWKKQLEVWKEIERTV